MRVLVTGAFGFIGRHLQSALLGQAGTEVFLLDRQPSAETRLPTDSQSEPAPVDVIHADLRDAGQIQQIISAVQPDIVFHLAAMGVGDPFLAIEDALSNNLYGTLNLLRALFTSTIHQPQKIIISRTPGEYTAMNTYAASKAAAWQICRMYARTKGWPIVGAAIFQAYGPGQPEQRLLPAAIIAALKDQNFPMTSGQQQKDWIYVTDVISGFMAIRDADLMPGTTIELGSGRLNSVIEVVQRVFTIIGGAGSPLPDALASRPGEAPLQRANVDEAWELIKWRAMVSLEEGLRQTINHLRCSQTSQS